MVRRSRRAPIRRGWKFPSLSPRNFADYVEGNGDVTLFAGRWELYVAIRLKEAMFDRVEDPRDWEPLRKGLRIGFDNPSAPPFYIRRASVEESTLSLWCLYHGGILDRIRRERKLRLGRADDPASGVLIEVQVRPTIRPEKGAPRDTPF